MSKDLSTITNSGRQKPSLQTPDQHRYLSSYTSAVAEAPSGTLEISHLSAPTPRMREGLEQRISELRRGISMEPMSRDAAGSLLSMIIDLFDAYPTVKMDADKANGVAKTFAAHVEHLPHWAVREGIFEIQGRKTPFPPSPGELKAACERRLQPMQEEIAQISKVLEAKTFHQNSDGERKRMIDGFEKLLSGLCSTNGFSEKPRRVKDYRQNPEEKAQMALDAINYRDRQTTLSNFARVAAGYALREETR